MYNVSAHQLLWYYQPQWAAPMTVQAMEAACCGWSSDRCFGRMIYALQTSMYLIIAKLLNHPGI